MAVCRGACLEVPGTSGLVALRAVRPLTGWRRRHGVRQWATLAKERRMDRGCRVSVEAAEPPRLALRVGGLKVGQQLLVVQVPQPGAIVRHPVGDARDEEVPLLIAVRPLMHRRQPEQVGCWRCRRHRSFGGPAEPSRVVRPCCRRRLCDVDLVHQDVVAGQRPRQLQLRVVDAAGGVVERYKLVCDLLRPSVPPQNWAV